jgi:predicted nucleic acid-binding protein
MVTIDASVLVAATAADDPAQQAAAAFLRVVVTRTRPIHQPTLSLVEVAAAIARRTGDAALARESGLRLLRMPSLALHALDVEAAADAASIAGRVMLRGADAVYAATALRHGTVLVTLDEELRARTTSILTTETPATWLDRHA